MPRTLLLPELLSYKSLCSEQGLRKVKIINVPFLPVPAVTLGSTIFVNDQPSMNGESVLLAHHITHVGQARKHGYWEFYTHYLWHFFWNLCFISRSFRGAFEEIPHEKYARGKVQLWQIELREVKKERLKKKK